MCALTPHKPHDLHVVALAQLTIGVTTAPCIQSDVADALALAAHGRVLATKTAAALVGAFTETQPHYQLGVLSGLGNRVILPISETVIMERGCLCLIIPHADPLLRVESVHLA